MAATDGGAEAEVTPLRKNRDFVLLWTGMAFSVLGSRISTIAYSLLVLATTGSATLAGAMAFIATVPHMLFALPAGVLIDRVDRKRLMIVSDAVRFVALGTLTVAVVIGRAPFALVAVVAFVEGSFHVFYNATQSVAVKHVLPESQLRQGIAQNEARERAVNLLGQPLGAFLFGVSRWMPFLVDTISYLVSTLLLLRIRKPFQSERAPQPMRNPFTEAKEGIVWLLRQPFLRTVCLVLAGSNLMFAALGLAVLVIAYDRGATETHIAFILAGAGIGGVAGSMFAPKVEEYLNLRWVVIGANWAWVLMLIPFLFSPSLVVVGVLFGAMSFVGPVWNVAVKSFTLGITPDRLIGRVSSAAGLLTFGAVPLGSLLAGPMLDGPGTTATIAALLGLMLVVAVGATAAPSVRRVVGLGERGRGPEDAEGTDSEGGSRLAGSRQEDE